jgi:hypothetical protein
MAVVEGAYTFEGSGRFTIRADVMPTGGGVQVEREISAEARDSG